MSRVFPREQWIEVTMRAERLSESGVVEHPEHRELTVTYLWPRELEHLLWRAGFELTRLDGDYEGTPFSEGGDELVFTARVR